jgi:transposase
VQLARSQPQARLLMMTPSVGPIVALTYACAIDDPERFRSSKAAGAHFGLTPKKYQSGQIDYTGRITKIGDASVREALYQSSPRHANQTRQELYRAEELGDADRKARRPAQGQGRVGAQARGRPASHARRAKPFNPNAKALPT